MGVEAKQTTTPDLSACSNCGFEIVGCTSSATVSGVVVKCIFCEACGMVGNTKREAIELWNENGAVSFALASPR